MAHLTFPNESVDYRRALPPGRALPEDYVFEWIGANGMPEKVEMSRLFAPHRTLVLYSFMYGPERNSPCPMCVRLLDSINGAASHVAQRASLYIVAKSPLVWSPGRTNGDGSICSFSRPPATATAPTISATRRSCRPPIRSERGIKDGDDWDETMFNVFRLDEGTVRHCWASELTWAPMEPGQHHRSGDAVNALWGMLDMTPECRGQFMPKLAY